MGLYLDGVTQCHLRMLVSKNLGDDFHEGLFVREGYQKFKQHFM